MVKKKTRKYKRPRILWDRVVSIEKGVEAEMDDDERKAVIIHLGFDRFGCKCQVKITENSNFHLLETQGVHNVDCHNPRKDKAKLQVIQTGVRILISFL